MEVRPRSDMLLPTAKPIKRQMRMESEDEGEGPQVLRRMITNRRRLCWSPSGRAGRRTKPVVVDRSISSFLRKHQIES